MQFKTIFFFAFCTILSSSSLFCAGKIIEVKRKPGELVCYSSNKDLFNKSDFISYQGQLFNISSIKEGKKVRQNIYGEPVVESVAEVLAERELIPFVLKYKARFGMEEGLESWCIECKLQPTPHVYAGLMALAGLGLYQFSKQS